MTTYIASNGAIVADLAVLAAIPSTDLPLGNNFVVLFVASENNWFEYKPSLTSGDIRPTDNPTNGYWIRIGREKLIINRTYYVRTDGNDLNNGLVNTSGGAFLTWAKAQAVLASLDGNGYSATVQFTGTFTTPIIIDSQFIGFSFIQLDGNTTTPSNAFINVTGISITISTSTPIRIKGIKFAGTVVGLTILNGFCEINGNLDFGTCGLFHIYVSGQKAQLNQRSGYIISGNAASHIALYDQGFIDANIPATTVTISGSLTFSDSFIILGRNASGYFANITYSGSVTGTKYIVNALCGLFVDEMTFPGSIAGIVDVKGYYGT